jgi:hypothetical protein
LVSCGRVRGTYHGEFDLFVMCPTIANSDSCAVNDGTTCTWVQEDFRGNGLHLGGGGGRRHFQHWNDTSVAPGDGESFASMCASADKGDMHRKLPWTFSVR